MRPWIVALLITLTGCAYVTKQEFEEYWDRDGDGWPLGEDCNDDDDRIFPFAPDVRGDGCDADCSREPDDDNDDWPNDADCDPDDPEIHPCSEFEVDGDGTDSDCDGSDDVREEACPGDDPDFEDEVAIEADSCPEGQQVP